MPLIKIIQVKEDAKLGIWHIEEPESFFKARVTISREIHHPHKRLQHFAARYLLQELFPGFPLSKIKIANSNKPYLEKYSFHFSLSHSGDYAAAIISRSQKTGIDIESGTKGINPVITKVAHKFLNDKEKKTCSLSGNQLLFQTICWTAKEAVYKWHGERGIDFKENIFLYPFSIKNKGEINCLFAKDNLKQPLLICYEVGEKYCVAWITEY